MDAVEEKRSDATTLQLRNPDLFDSWWETDGRIVVRSFVKKFLRQVSREDYEDLVQTICIRFWKTIMNKNFNAKPTTVLYYIIWSTCSNYKFAWKKQQKHFVGLEDCTNIPEKEIDVPLEMPDIGNCFFTELEKGILDGIKANKRFTVIANELKISKQRTHQIYLRLIKKIRWYIGEENAEVSDENAVSS